MRQQLLNLCDPLRRQPRQHILEISIRIMPIDARRLDQAHDHSRPFAASQRPRKQPVRPPKRPGPDQVLDLIVVDGRSTIFQVARQRYSAFEAVIQSLGRGRTLRHKFTLSQHPLMQLLSDGHRRFLAQSPAIFVAHSPGVSLDLVQTAD